MMDREFNYEIMTEIKERWSPRAFSEKAVDEDDLMALLEAARYATAWWKNTLNNWKGSGKSATSPALATGVLL